MGQVQGKPSKCTKNEIKNLLPGETAISSNRCEKVYTFPDKNREVPSDLEDLPIETEERNILKTNICTQNMTK